MGKWTMIFVVCAVTLAPVAWAQPVPPADFPETTISVGDCVLNVQVAKSSEQLEYGLMNRKTVKPWDGMMFVFPSARPMTFWMKDTLIPLEVGYFDDRGILREVYHMKPKDLTPIRSKSVNVRYALELPEGDFEWREIKLGEVLSFSNINKVAK